MATGAEVARLFVTVGADITGLTVGMASATAQLQRAGKAMMGIGVGLTAAVSLPLLRIGKEMVETAATFEAKMKIIEGLALGTGGSVEELEAAIRAVGRATDAYGMDAMGAADAVAELYRSGQTANQIFGDMQGVIEGTASVGGTLRSVINLVAASELEAAAASELVIQSMTTFGLTAEETTGMVDLLVKAANASIMDVSDMAGSFKNAAPTLAMFGWTADEVVTALALISQHGIAGSEAGTALKRMFMNMQRPTKAVQETLDMLGVSMYDVTGAMKDAPQIMAELESALWGSSSAVGVLTEQQRNLAMQTIFGFYGIKAGSAILKEGVVGWQAMTQAIQEQADAEEIARIRLEGMKGQLTLLKKAMTDLLITVGLPFIQNFLTPLVTRVTQITKWFASLDESTQQLALGIGLAAAAVGPFLLILGFMITTLGAILSPLGLVITGAIALGAAFVASQGGITGAWQTLTRLWETITTALQPALAKLPQAWANIVASFKADGLIAAIKTAFSEIGSMAEALTPLRDAILSNLQTWGAVIGAKLWEVFSTAFPDLSAIIETAWADPGAAAAILGQKLSDVALSAVDYFKTSVLPATYQLGAAIGDMLRAAQDWFVQNSGDLGQKIGEAFGTVIRVAVKLLIAQVAAFGALLYSFFAGMVDDSVATDNSEMTAAILKFFGGVLNGLITGLTGDPQWAAKVREFFIYLFADIEEWALEVAGQAVSVGAAIVEGLIKGIKDNANKAIDAAKGMVNDAIQAAKNLLGISSPSTVFAEIGINLMAGFAEGISQGKADVMKRLGEALGEIVKAFGRLSEISAMFSTTGGAPSNIGQVMEALESTVMAAMTTVERIIARVGYDRIHKLKLTARRLAEVLESVSFDLSTIKLYDLPNLDLWASQLEGVFNASLDLIERLAQTWGEKAIKAGADLVQSVKDLFVLIGIDLSGIVPSDDAGFGEKTRLYFVQLEAVGEAAMAWLSRISADWAAKVALAAPLAENIAKVFTLIGVDLAKIVPVNADTFESVVVAYFAQLERVGQEIMSWLRRIAANPIWASAVDAVAPLAEKLRTIFELIGVSLTGMVPQAELGFGVRLTAYVAQLELTGQQLMDWLKRIGANAAWVAAVDNAAGLVEKLKQIFSILSTDFGAFAGASEAATVVSSWRTITDTIVDSLQKIRLSVSSELSQIVVAIQGKYEAIRMGLEAPFRDAYNTIAQILAAIGASLGELPGTGGGGPAGGAGGRPSWFGNGVDAVFARPTLIGVGERGPERVTVTPFGRSSGVGSVTGEMSGAINVNVDMKVNGRKYRTLQEQLQNGRVADMNLRRMTVLV